MNELFFLNRVWVSFSKVIRFLKIGLTGKTGQTTLPKEDEDVKKKMCSSSFGMRKTVCEIADCYRISRTVASETPPPPQSVAMPRVFPRFFIAWMRVTMIRHPVEPTGWPRPTPEPLTLTTIAVESELALAAQILGGEGLVHFDQFEIGEGETRPGQEVPDGRDGAQPHDGGMAAAAPDGLDPGEGFQARVLSPFRRT